MKEWVKFAGLTVAVVAAMFVIGFRDNQTTADRDELNHWRVFANTIPGGLFRVNQDGFITYENPAVSRMFGYERLVGRPITDIMPAAYEPRHADYFSFKREETRRRLELNILEISECDGIRADGTSIRIHLRIHGVRIGDEFEFWVFIDPRKIVREITVET